MELHDATNREHAGLREDITDSLRRKLTKVSDAPGHGTIPLSDKAVDDMLKIVNGMPSGREYIQRREDLAKELRTMRDMANAYLMLANRGPGNLKLRAPNPLAGLSYPSVKWIVRRQSKRGVMAPFTDRTPRQRCFPTAAWIDLRVDEVTPSNEEKRPAGPAFPIATAEF
ncbi:MAG: hypothetical protein GY696_34735, partial [Gammaproteobacteria bacterium]|nr:hypothetical protein [Gammaproteobacteria bacterium]